MLRHPPQTPVLYRLHIHGNAFNSRRSDRDHALRVYERYRAVPIHASLLQSF